MSGRSSRDERLPVRQVRRIAAAGSDEVLARRLGSLSMTRVSVWVERLLEGEVSVGPVVADRSARLLSSALYVRPVSGVEGLVPFLDPTEGRGLVAAAAHLADDAGLLSAVLSDRRFPWDAFAAVRADRLVAVTSPARSVRANRFINRQVRARLLSFTPLDHVVVRKMGERDPSPLGVLVDEYCDAVFELDRTHRAMLAVMVAHGSPLFDVASVGARVAEVTEGWSRDERLALLADHEGVAVRLFQDMAA